MKKILAFSGSNSKNSINQRLIEMTSSMINTENIEVEVVSLRDFEASIYSIDKEMEDGFPESMHQLKTKFDAANGFIVSTPEHNGSMPAVLKNTFDWISRMGGKIFQDKPVVFLSTSPGPRGGASALQHLVSIMPYRGANIVGHFSLGNFEENITQDKLVVSAETEIKDRIDALLAEI